MAIIELDQTLDTPLTTYKRGNFVLRYAYARSKDAKQAGLRGEDYLVFRTKSTRMAFAVCDGVGSSFYGGLAAQIVGEVLIQWLWSNTETKLLENSDPKQILGTLRQYMDRQVKFSDEFVNNKDLSELTNQFVRGSYEDKREKGGSQSNFVCGWVQAPTKQRPTGDVWLFWLGDAKLKIWKRFEDKTNLIGALFESEQSWSSNDGIRGKVYAYHTDINEIDFIIAHTDGLNPFENKLRPNMDSSKINQAVEYLQDSSDSDDISYLEISVDENILKATDDLVEDLREKLYFSPQEQQELVDPIETSEISVVTDDLPIKAQNQPDQNIELANKGTGTIHLPPPYWKNEPIDSPSKTNTQDAGIENENATFKRFVLWGLAILFLILVSVLIYRYLH